MTRQQRPITDRELKAWLAAGPVDRGVGGGLTFVASTTAALAGKASWILRFRLNGRFKEKVLGRYPELSLKDARELARQDRAQIERGIDVAAAKQAEKALLLEVPTVQRLGEVWFAKYIQPRYKHPEVVARVLRKHINPVIGPVAPPDVQPAHIDRVLTRIVAGGAPTVANDALRYMSRMFRMAARNHWIERNPAADFDLVDAGGDEVSRDRWLTVEELQELARAMRTTPNFGRENELSVWLLLALCVRKMELLSARWDAFDLDAGIWTLVKENTKTRSSIRIPLAADRLDEIAPSGSKTDPTHACGHQLMIPYGVARAYRVYCRASCSLTCRPRAMQDFGPNPARRRSRLHPRVADMPLTGDSLCNATRLYQRPAAPRP